jgi:hypothetical protein
MGDNFNREGSSKPGMCCFRGFREKDVEDDPEPDLKEDGGLDDLGYLVPKVHVAEEEDDFVCEKDDGLEEDLLSFLGPPLREIGDE